MNTGQDTEQVVADYWKREGFTFDAVLDPKGKERNNAKSLGLMASPTNIVVDKNGKVTYATVGFNEKQIRQYLGL